MAVEILAVYDIRHLLKLWPFVRCQPRFCPFCQMSVTILAVSLFSVSCIRN